MMYALMVLMLGVLILIHELGHFVAAKWGGIPIARFSLGIGPRLWSRKYKGTEYILAMLPIGGYILPSFEEEAEFFAVPLRRRIAFFAGGPLANMLVVIPLFAVLNIYTNGASFAHVLIAPFVQATMVLWQIYLALPQIVSDPGQLSGPVGIVMYGATLVGITKWLGLAIILSLNLAVINMLPIPILDGGKILLHILAKLDRRLLRFQVSFALVGLLLIIGVMVYATIMDIARYMA